MNAVDIAEDSFTVDAFHRGDFRVVQPKGRGHRSGIDALLLAAAVPGGFSGKAADLGAGAGAAGLAVASRCPASQVALVERDIEMASFARASAALPENAHLAARIEVLEADVTLTGKARVLAGLADDHFDFAIMNPPFNAEHDRQTQDPLKQQAHIMSAGLFEAWCRCAAGIVKPKGGVAIIARPQSLPEIFSALVGRFGGLEIVPVQPRAQEPAIRVVVRGSSGSRRALTLCPPLILHEAAGNHFAARADQICNGRASLFVD